MDLVDQQLSGSRITQMSRQLGISEQRTREALPAALAALTGAMAQNASQQNPQARGGLGALLDRDGQIMDDLADLAGGMLGNRR